MDHPQGWLQKATSLPCTCSASAAFYSIDIRWSDFVTNSAVTEKTGLPDIRAVINDRKLALFGHVRHLPEGTPAYDVLHALVIEAHAGMVPHLGWRRKPGRLRCAWLRDVLKVTRLTAREAWTAADDWGNRERSGPPPTTRSDDDDDDDPKRSFITMQAK